MTEPITKLLARTILIFTRWLVLWLIVDSFASWQFFLGLLLFDGLTIAVLAANIREANIFIVIGELFVIFFGVKLVGGPFLLTMVLLIAYLGIVVKRLSDFFIGLGLAVLLLGLFFITGVEVDKIFYAVLLCSVGISLTLFFTGKTIKTLLNQTAITKDDLEMKCQALEDDLEKQRQVLADKINSYSKFLANIRFTLDEKNNVNTLMKLVEESTDAVAGSFYVWNEEDGCFDLQSKFGTSTIIIPDSKIKPGQGIIGERYYNPKVFIEHDVMQKQPSLARKCNLRSFVVIPVSAENRLIGVLSVGFSENAAAKQMDKMDKCLIAANLAALEFEKALATKRIQKAAITDPLTGIYNRMFYDQQASIEIQKCAANNYSVAMIMIDVDYFKQVNDTYGHAHGNLVLQTVANVLKKNIRKNDIAVRMGGDEFCLLLPTASATTAYQIANQIQQDFAKYGFTGRKDNKEMMVTFSIGIAVCPEHGSTLDQLFEAADRALYCVKKVSKNAIKIYDLNDSLINDENF